ncbi:MAG TPA: twin-arginine translocation signal domain-containing protein [Myxococcota bacterium]|nr:twin-arginine translocation signal domain-containing protein [Myxococcota bacterium]
MSEDPSFAAFTRRTFLRGAAAAALALPLASRLAGALEAPAPLPSRTVAALETSSFVYVCPLRRDGRESTCHGEVWYAWLDGTVVLTTAKLSWKARSAERGLERARLWVGNYGRWKQMLGHSEAFRAGPSFDARVRKRKDEALLTRLLAAYEKKYPSEFPSWRDRMRAGNASGERVLLQYEPAPL